MSEKDRDEIAGMLTKRGIEDLGAPWLSMAETPPVAYLPPPLPPYTGPTKDRDNGDDSGPLSLQGSIKGSAGSIDKLRRLDPDIEMRMRYKRAF